MLIRNKTEYGPKFVPGPRTIQLIFIILGLMGACCGLIWFYLIPIRKKDSLENMRNTLGQEASEKELRRILRKSYMHWATCWLELPLAYWMNNENSRYVIQVVDMDKLQKVCSQKKPVIFTSIHAGNFELFTAISKDWGLPPRYAIMRRIQNHRLNTLMIKILEGLGITLIFSNGAIPKLCHAISQNGAIAVMTDQRMRKGYGIFADILGKPARISQLSASLSHVTGAIPFFCHAVRSGWGQHTIYMHGIVDIPGQTNPVKKVQQMTQTYADLLSEAIRKHPDQWFWMHRLWRDQPHAHSHTEEELVIKKGLKKITDSFIPLQKQGVDKQALP